MCLLYLIIFIIFYYDVCRYDICDNFFIVHILRSIFINNYNSILFLTVSVSACK